MSRIEELLNELERKAEEGDEYALNFLRLFNWIEDPLLRRNAMRCSIEINLYLNKFKWISEEKVLELARKYECEDIVKLEMISRDIDKFLYFSDEN
jgi:hypothetical protein